MTKPYLQRWVARWVTRAFSTGSLLGAMASALLVLAAAGCGDSSNTGTVKACPASDCGGNPVGQWQVSGVCGSLMLPAQGLCQGATAQLNFTNASGTLKVVENMTYEQQLTLSANGTLMVPGQCVKDASIMSCAAAAPVLMNALEGFIGQGTVTNVQCTGSVDDKCTCTFAVMAPVGEMGTWTQAGNQVTKTPSVQGAEVSTLTFCQKDNTLSVKNSEGWGLTFTK